MDHPFLLVGIPTLGALLLGAGLLHLIPRLGAPGRALADRLCRAPGLDLVITYFTAAPMIVGPILAGWWGLAGGIAAQVLAVLIWTPLHELANRDAVKGPRIVHVINRKVGRVRNHTAVWITAGAVPLFWIVRLAQYLLWPPIRALVRFPRYNAADWVNVSRQKFRGLVGHDLIWCLYCDWMTGIWSLGSEMLRNVESFWCPIRFASDKKCDNCSVDFPDIKAGWIAADKGMAEVAAELDERMDGRFHGWFGHPARLTVEGRQPRQPSEPPAPAP